MAPSRTTTAEPTTGGPIRTSASGGVERQRRVWKIEKGIQACSASASVLSSASSSVLSSASDSASALAPVPALASAPVGGEAKAEAKYHDAFITISWKTSPVL